jgi:hypothetical protein
VDTIFGIRRHYAESAEMVGISPVTIPSMLPVWIAPQDFMLRVMLRQIALAVKRVCFKTELAPRHIHATSVKLEMSGKISIKVVRHVAEECTRTT